MRPRMNPKLLTTPQSTLLWYMSVCMHNTPPLFTPPVPLHAPSRYLLVQVEDVTEKEVEEVEEVEVKEEV